MSPPRALVAALGAALFVFAGSAIAQDAQSPAIRFLDAIPGKEVGVTYAVVPGADVVLPFTVDRAGTIEVFLSPFRGEHGEAVSIQPSIDGAAGASVKGDRVVFTAVAGAILNLRLKVPALSEPGKYSGTLTVLVDGRHHQTERLVFTRARAQRPATISVDWRSPVVHAPGTFNLQVRNTSDEWRADGVFVRLLDVTAPAGRNFDAARNLKLTWNGADADDLWRSPPAGSRARSIEPNQQVEIGGQLRGLAPGEYTVKLGLGAANAAAPTDQQPITLKLFVRHGVWLPLVVLLMAILLSFFATKGIEAQLRRGAALRKVDEIRRGFRAQQRYSMPVVAARAFLNQAEDRNATLFDALFGQDTTSALVAKAELLCRILDRAERLGGNIESAPWRTMIRHRARKRLNAVIASLNPERMDEKEATKLEADLAELEKWLDPKQAEALYQADFRPDLDRLVARATPDQFQSHAGLVERLRNEIAAGPVERTERAYGMLKVLWELNRDHQYDRLNALGDLLEGKPDMADEAFFAAADAAAWAQLESATFRFAAPAINAVEPRPAYELIRFEIVPEDGRLGDNFLFKHGLTYRWSLTLDDGTGPRDLTQETTTEPRIVQYAPKPGKLSVKVDPSFGGRLAAKPIHLPSLPIGGSSDYGWQSVFKWADVAALAIAILFASITGLTTYYFSNHAFGTISDYVALFVWGAGVDQTKNFIQQLGRT